MREQYSPEESHAKEFPRLSCNSFLPKRRLRRRGAICTTEPTLRFKGKMDNFEAKNSIKQGKEKNARRTNGTHFTRVPPPPQISSEFSRFSVGRRTDKPTTKSESHMGFLNRFAGEMCIVPCLGMMRLGHC